MMTKLLLSLLASVNFLSVSAFAMDASADEQSLSNPPVMKNSPVILTLLPRESLNLTGPTHPNASLVIIGRGDLYALGDEEASTRPVTPETTLNIYDDTFSTSLLSVKHLAKVNLFNISFKNHTSLHIKSSELNIDECLFERGSDIFVYSKKTTISNTVFKGQSIPTRFIQDNLIVRNSTFEDGAQLETDGSDKITIKGCTLQNKASLSVFASKILVENSKFLGESLFKTINSFIFFNMNTVDNSVIRHINSEAHFWRNIFENKALIETYFYKDNYLKTHISPPLFSEQHRNYEMSEGCSRHTYCILLSTALKEEDHLNQGRRIHFTPEENLGNPWKED